MECARNVRRSSVQSVGNEIISENIKGKSISFYLYEAVLTRVLIMEELPRAASVMIRQAVKYLRRAGLFPVGRGWQAGYINRRSFLGS